MIILLIDIQSLILPVISQKRTSWTQLKRFLFFQNTGSSMFWIELKLPLCGAGNIQTAVDEKKLLFWAASLLSKALSSLEWLSSRISWRPSRKRINVQNATIQKNACQVRYGTHLVLRTNPSQERKVPPKLRFFFSGGGPTRKIMTKHKTPGQFYSLLILDF